MTSAPPVRWWCSRCEQPLHLEDTLWKSPEGDYRCRVGGYPSTGGGMVTYVERTMHQVSSSWTHPDLRTEDKEESA